MAYNLKVISNNVILYMQGNEVDLNLKEPMIPYTSSPLEWWKVNCNKYPNLAKLANKYLCVQGSSVASERTNYLVDKLIFLHINKL